MSEDTSATWLMPPSWNSELGLSGLIMSRNSCKDRDLNVTSDSGAINVGEGNVTVSPREQLPTLRGRQTQAAIDAAARVVFARKGFLATTISDIAAEAGKSTTSFYNYYDSKESMAYLVDHGFSVDDDPKLIAVALVSMLNQFCYPQLSGIGSADSVDDEACINTLATVF